MDEPRESDAARLPVCPALFGCETFPVCDWVSNRGPLIDDWLTAQRREGLDRCSASIFITVLLLFLFHSHTHKTETKSSVSARFQI